LTTREEGTLLSNRGASMADIVRHLPGGEASRIGLVATLGTAATVAVAVFTEQGLSLLMGPLIFGAAAFFATTRAFMLLRMRSVKEVALDLVGVDSRPVRLRGTVEPVEERVMRAPGTTRDVVFERTIFFGPSPNERAGVRTLREVKRGIPFRVRLQDGRAMLVDPASVELLDPPRLIRDPGLKKALGISQHGWLGRRVRQSCLFSGDAIEVVGRVESQVSRLASAAPARGTPIVSTLLPVDVSGVWIRNIPRH
jgi:hypothetical protein